MADAGTTADLGTIEGLEMAIAEAEEIDSISSVYYEAQHLVERWQLEIEDIRHLEKARELAQTGELRRFMPEFQKLG